MSNDPLNEIKLDCALIVRAYRAGIFPMAENADDSDIFWVSPEKRGIIPLDKFHVSKSLKKVIKKGDFEIKIDNDFKQVIHACANFGSERDSTWINQSIIDVYSDLFEQKICHTVEVWQNEKLVGGLYGLAIGGAFFGESMFHTVSNASKIALFYLVKRLKASGYTLLDTQFLTNHLASLGGIEVTRERYEFLLNEALKINCNFIDSLAV